MPSTSPNNCGPLCACENAQLIPTFNAKRKKRLANPLRRDPTRTTGLVRRFQIDLAKRLAALKRDITKLVVEDDAFALKDNTSRVAALPNSRTLGLLVANATRRWEFLTAPQKVTQFRTWLDEQIGARLLSVESGADAWTAKYVYSAYKQGVLRAWTDTNRQAFAAAGNVEAHMGARSQFLLSSFNGPETITKLQLLATRSYEGLRGITASMSTSMARIFADGIAAGKGPLVIAKELREAIDKIGLRRARVLARTEIMHAHAEGQLDSFEALGVDELGVMAEWSTAGDDRVCPICQPLEGVIMTVDEARGLIPRHPNCRCTWIPANVGEKQKGQTTTRTGIASRVASSLLRETGKKTVAAARDSSTWLGADRVFATKFLPDE